MVSPGHIYSSISYGIIKNSHYFIFENGIFFKSIYFSDRHDNMPYNFILLENPLGESPLERIKLFFTFYKDMFVIKVV